MRQTLGRCLINEGMETETKMTISSKWVEVKGLRIHYLTAGTGAPVFLLHGGGTDSASLS
jgi:hypothetical protein